MALWLLAGQVLAADQERIERTITALATHGPRMAGYPGDGFAADLIERELVKAGVTGVVRESFVVAVPMERGAALEILGQEQEIPLASLWPNLVRTSTTGPEGIEGVLVYGGESEYASFDGMEVAGCVVLMEFNTWNNWQNAAALGARAIVFIAPEETTVFEARQKWHWAPLDVPRFWLERPLGLELRARLQQEALQVRVRARMDWEEHTSWNIWGVVPGVDPQLGKELWAVQAYYDGLSVVPGLNPAAESAAGIAALLELAHDLKEHPPGRSVALIATGGHFLGQAGIKAFLNRHARQKKPFRERMPKKFVADSLDTQRLVEELGERGLTPDSLGIHLKKDRASGLLELDSVELDTLVARLKLKRLEADSLAIPLQPDELEIEFFIALDLSSQSDQLGVWHNTRNAAYRRFFVPVGRSFTQHAEKAAQALGRASSRALANGISPIKGLSWDSYVSQDVVIPDGALAQSAGLMAVSLMTVNDARLSLDTPLDRPERVAFDHIHQQSELLNRLLHGVLSDADFFGPDGEALRQAHDKNITDILVDIRGGLRLLPRKSTTPDQGVAHGVVALEPPFNNKPWRPWIFVADEEGNYRARGLVPGSHRVQGFVLDERSGAVVYATDRGERAQAFGLVEQSLSKAETEWTTVVFPAAATENTIASIPASCSPWGATAAS
jgi:hypothetical protein